MERNCPHYSKICPNRPNPAATIEIAWGHSHRTDAVSKKPVIELPSLNFWRVP